MLELVFTPQADSDLQELEDNPSKKKTLQAVREKGGRCSDLHILK